jgi:hypothetical protein
MQVSALVSKLRLNEEVHPLTYAHVCSRMQVSALVSKLRLNEEATKELQHAMKRKVHPLTYPDVC